ncbi:MAG: hypothetical protein CL912_17565 [Deltaproteobacteria bacterium]|nr:hypothetical protein [Deltaproteobacteria bacterium]
MDSGGLALSKVILVIEHNFSFPLSPAWLVGINRPRLILGSLGQPERPTEIVREIDIAQGSRWYAGACLIMAHRRDSIARSNFTKLLCISYEVLSATALRKLQGHGTLHRHGQHPLLWSVIIANNNNARQITYKINLKYDK